MKGNKVPQNLSHQNQKGMEVGQVCGSLSRELLHTHSGGRSFRKKGHVWNSFNRDIELMVGAADTPGRASSIWTCSFKIAPGAAYQIGGTLTAAGGGLRGLAPPHLPASRPSVPIWACWFSLQQPLSGSVDIYPAPPILPDSPPKPPTRSLS